MHLRCPHCQNRIEVEARHSLSDLVCPSCGSQFNLISGETVTREHTHRSIGHFELLEQVGAGKFGIVWKARDSQLGRIVAVKVPRRGQLDFEETEFFFRDARAAAQLQHPHVVGVHEVGRDGDSIYIVSEFIEGANLKDWLTGQRLTARESAELMIKIAEAVQHAHDKGVIHRDLKPSNILMDLNGEPHVADFGLAKRDAGEITMTVSGQILGTPAYMSPEQASGNAHNADARSDVYSLGVILFELLTGELPFRGESRMLVVQILRDDAPSPRKFNARVPRDLETITLKCLDKDPAKRYPNSQSLADELRRFVAGEPILARPITRFNRGWRWCRRNPLVATLSAALLLVLTAAAVIAPLVALHQSKLRREADRLLKLTDEKNVELQNQLAENLFERASLEYDAGRFREAIALLATAYPMAQDGNPLHESIRMMLPGWSAQAGWFLVRDDPVLAVTFSPSGDRILSGSYEKKTPARLWDVKTGMPLQAFPHENNVRAVAFGPGGKVLTGSADHTAQLWDAATGERLGQPMQHKDEVLAVAFSPDGLKLLTGSKDKTARLWDAATKEPIGAPLKHDGIVRSVAFNNATGSNTEGRIALTGCWDNTVRQWDAKTGAPIKTFETLRHDGWVNAVSFSPDNTRILSCSRDHTARLWDATTGKPINPSMMHADAVYSAVFSHDGSKILTGCCDNTARLWDAQTCQPIGEPIRLNGWVMSVAFSPDGRMIATGSADKTIRIVRIADSRLLQREEISCFAFSPDGQMLSTANMDGSLKLWNVQTGKPQELAPPGSAKVRSITINHAGTVLLTAGDDKTARMWDIETHNPQLWPLVHDSKVTFADFTIDECGVLTICENRKVQLWDAHTGERLPGQWQIGADCKDMKVSPDCRTIFVLRTDGSGQLYNAENGQTIGEPLRDKSGTEGIMSIAFSPDSRLVLTGGYDQRLQLWKTSTGEPVGKGAMHDGLVDNVMFSRDGKMMFSASADKTARFWSVPNGTPLGEPLRHAQEISKIALSPDQRLAITVCKDGMARLWDVQTCKPLAAPLQYEASVKKAAFSPDGRVVLFECNDNSVRLYDVPQPFPDDAELIRAWSRARTGLQLDEHRFLSQLSQTEWLEAQKELEKLRGDLELP